MSRIVTGSFDWSEQADATREMGNDWDPATGGSLQELRLRDIFQDPDDQSRTISNHTPDLVVTEASSQRFGDLEIALTGGFRLRGFIAGSRGEFWRIFKKGDLSSHFVCEGQNEGDSA